MRARAWLWIGLAWSSAWLGITIGQMIIRGAMYPLLWVCMVALAWQMVWFWCRIQNESQDGLLMIKRRRQAALKGFACALVWADRQHPSNPRHHLTGHARDSAIAAVDEIQEIKQRLKEA